MPTPDVIICLRRSQLLRYLVYWPLFGVTLAIWLWYPFLYSFYRYEFLLVAFIPWRWIINRSTAQIIADETGLTWDNPWPLASIQVPWSQINDYYRTEKDRHFIVTADRTLNLDPVGEWDNELLQRVVERAERLGPRCGDQLKDIILRHLPDSPESKPR